VKPETLKSILSLVRNADSRSSGGSTRDAVGADVDRAQQCVTSHAKTDDVIDDVAIGDRCSSRCDVTVDADVTSHSDTQEEQMRLATEGE